MYNTYICKEYDSCTQTRGLKTRHHGAISVLVPSETTCIIHIGSGSRVSSVVSEGVERLVRWGPAVLAEICQTTQT